MTVVVTVLVTVRVWINGFDGACVTPLDPLEPVVAGIVAVGVVIAVVFGVVWLVAVAVV